MKLPPASALAGGSAPQDGWLGRPLAWPRFVAAALVSALALTGLVGAFNFYIDPAHLAGDRGDIVLRVASLLDQGRFVEVINGLDDRRLQRARLETMAHTPDVLILGSSRSRDIGTELFPAPTRLVNASVNAGSLDDLVALAGLFDSAGKLPRQVIIDVDPWLFNAAYRPAYYRVLQPEYDATVAAIHGQAPADAAAEAAPRATAAGEAAAPAPAVPVPPPALHDRLGALGAAFARWRDLFTLAQLRASMVEIRRNGFRRSDIVRVVPETSPDFIYRPDGSFRWALYLGRETEASQAARLLKYEAEAKPGELFIQLVGFSGIGEDRKQLFEGLVRYLEARGVSVTLLLLPYHPRTYTQYLPQNGLLKPIREVEAYVKSFAAGEGIEVIGSFDPAPYHCGPLEFVDQHHPLPPCAARILTELKPRQAGPAPDGRNDGAGGSVSR